MGKILDICWRFAEAGDQFLGRVLCLLNPNDESFANLPPHFDIDEPMDDKDIKEGMRICFDTILKAHTSSFTDPTSFFLLLLASTIYNHE